MQKTYASDPTPDLMLLKRKMDKFDRIFALKSKYLPLSSTVPIEPWMFVYYPDIDETLDFPLMSDEEVEQYLVYVGLSKR